MDTTIFIKKANEIWNYKYDYSNTIYTHSNIYITYKCKEHGIINQLPQNHYKYGCGKCGRKNNKRNILLKNNCSENFISKANEIHSNSYDYSKVNYINSITKVIIICKIHGDFLQSPNGHLAGKGCSKCGVESSKNSKILPFQDFISEFVKKYGDKYDYSHVIWQGSSKKIKVICRNHGEFNIIAYDHKKGRECPKCSNQYSKTSIGWLKYLEVKYNINIQHAENLGEYIIPNSKYKVDGYCKETNTVFEFNGDFWHGNPKIYNQDKINPRTKSTFKQLYDETIKKKEYIVNKGFNFVEIWERDWKILINTVRKLQQKFKKRKNELSSTN